MNRNEEFGRRLRELRKEKEIADGRKWTCKEVSKAIGITESGYTNYENALRIPKLELIETIAHFYRVSPSYIACFTDNKGNSTSESLLVLPTMTAQAKNEADSPLGDVGLSPELLARHQLNEDDLLLEKIKDNAMAGQLIKDDLVVIRKTPNIHADEINMGIYCIKAPNQQLWIRWIKPEMDGSFKIYPNNTTHYESFTFSRDEFLQYQIVGTIFTLIRMPRFDDI